MKHLLFLLLLSVMLAACKTGNIQHLNGTWVSGNYLDSAVDIITIRDSIIQGSYSYNYSEEAKVRIFDGYMLVDSGYLAMYECSSMSYTEGDTIHYASDKGLLELYSNDSHIALTRCDSITTEQQLFANKMLTAALPRGYNDRYDSLYYRYSVHDIFIGKPKKAYASHVRNNAPFVMQLNDTFKLPDDIRDFIEGSIRSFAMLYADKHVPMSYINEVREELCRCQTYHAFVAINETGKISYIRSPMLFRSFHPEDALVDLPVIPADLHLFIDSLGNCLFRGEQIPPQDVAIRLTQFFESETKPFNVQLSYSPSTTLQSYLNVMGALLGISYAKMVNYPDFYIGIADNGFTGKFDMPDD